MFARVASVRRLANRAPASTTRLASLLSAVISHAKTSSELCARQPVHVAVAADASSTALRAQKTRFREFAVKPFCHFAPVSSRIVDQRDLPHRIDRLTRLWSRMCTHALLVRASAANRSEQLSCEDEQEGFSNGVPLTLDCIVVALLATHERVC